jgi:[1-hydroxy-2-(trimethylamino)ethyl]phosphonate dioxygenase
MLEADGKHCATTITVIQLFQRRGSSQYGGEAVSQQEHALQAAYFAEKAGVGSSLITAALLHDVGHLLHHLDDDAPERGIDDQHETLAAQWLLRRFGPDVVEPVRLHVAAKRFLCATEPSYLAQLSPASLVSLRLQGGVMSDEEITEFRANPFYEAAVALRRWDDFAKQPQLVTPPIEHYARHLDRVAKSDFEGDFECLS